MLILMFYIGPDVYAIGAEEVIEVVPLVDLKVIPHSPAHVAGVFNYRGRIVPVLDFCQLVSSRPCERRLSSRIILARCPGLEGGGEILGVLAERVTETVSKDREEFSLVGIRIDEVPYLGGIATGEEGMIQLVRVDRLVSASIREDLFGDAGTEGGPVAEETAGRDEIG